MAQDDRQGIPGRAPLTQLWAAPPCGPPADGPNHLTQRAPARDPEKHALGEGRGGSTFRIGLRAKAQRLRAHHTLGRQLDLETGAYAAIDEADIAVMGVDEIRGDCEA